MHVFYILNLADLKLGLDDLFTKRHDALLLTKIGAGYEDILTFQRNAIDSLPPALTGGRPNVEALARTDGEHDGLGGGIFFMTEAYLRVPSVPANVKAAVRRIRGGFIPKLGGLQESYADQAAAAAERKENLIALEADLKLVPLVGGGTLLDWAKAFIGAGEQLSILLSQRADVDSKTRKAASNLRSETVGILNEMRDGIARERARKPGLPKDLDEQIFSYFDALEEQREAANRAAKAAKEAGEPSEGPKTEAGEEKPD